MFGIQPPINKSTGAIQRRGTSKTSSITSRTPHARSEAGPSRRPMIISSEDLQQFKNYLVSQLKDIYRVTNAKESALRSETLQVMDWTNTQIEQQHNKLLEDIALLTDAIDGKTFLTETQPVNTRRVLSEFQECIQQELHQHAQQLDAVYNELVLQKQNSTDQQDQIALLMATTAWLETERSATKVLSLRNLKELAQLKLGLSNRLTQVMQSEM